jgi:hypothetical protein
MTHDSILVHERLAIVGVGQSPVTLSCRTDKRWRGRADEGEPGADLVCIFLTRLVQTRERSL